MEPSDEFFDELDRLKEIAERLENDELIRRRDELQDLQKMAERLGRALDRGPSGSEGDDPATRAAEALRAEAEDLRRTADRLDRRADELHHDRSSDDPYAVIPSLSDTPLPPLPPPFLDFDEEGGAAVREPRPPVPSLGGSGAEVEIPREDEREDLTASDAV